MSGQGSRACLQVGWTFQGAPCPSVKLDQSQGWGYGANLLASLLTAKVEGGTSGKIGKLEFTPQGNGLKLLTSAPPVRAAEYLSSWHLNALMQTWNICGRTGKNNEAAPMSTLDFLQRRLIWRQPAIC